MLQQEAENQHPGLPIFKMKASNTRLKRSDHRAREIGFGLFGVGLRQALAFRRAAVTIVPLISTMRSFVASRAVALLLSAPSAVSSYSRLSRSSSATSARSAVPVLSLRCRTLKRSIIESSDAPSAPASAAATPPLAEAAAETPLLAAPREEALEAAREGVEGSSRETHSLPLPSPSTAALASEPVSPVSGKRRVSRAAKFQSDSQACPLRFVQRERERMVGTCPDHGRIVRMLLERAKKL